MRALLLLPVAVAVQVLETQQPTHAHVDYEGLRVTLKGIAAQTKEGKIDNVTESNVRDILKTVKSDLMSALYVDRNNSQSMYDLAVQDIQDCDDDRATWFVTAPEGLQSYDLAVSAAAKAHDDCRHAEQGLCTRRNNNCDAIDDIVENIHQNMCPVPDFAAGDSASVNTFMTCMTTLVCANYERYDSGRTTCRTDCANLSAKTAACHLKQTAEEIAACQRETAVQMQCKSYRDCRKRTETSYYQVKSTTEAEESLFQAQRVALECLLCYGNAILNENQDFAHCDSPPECSALTDCPTITYITAKPPIAFQKCTEPADSKPCEGAWTAAAYGPWNTGEISRNKCIPAVDACTTCGTARKGEAGDEGAHDNSGCVVPS